MTEFLPHPQAEALPASRGSTAATRPAAVPSGASLLAAVHQLAEALTSQRVPRIDSLRQRVQHAGHLAGLEELDAALHGVHDDCAELDFLAGRRGQAQAERFRSQGAAVAASAARLASLSLIFVGRHAAEAATTRIAWIELGMECSAADKRAHKGLKLLAQLEEELAGRRAAATAAVTLQALQEFTRRGHRLEERLHQVEGLCGAGRAARSLADQAGLHWAELARVLQDEVRPGCAGLQHFLQPLVQAAGSRALETTELLAAVEAHHALQVALTNAMAELLHLRAVLAELHAQLVWMERKAKALG